MANREENLKKINYELELMSDDELEQVVGGDVGETTRDSKFLYNYGLVDDWHSGFNFTFHWEKYSAEVDAGWAKAGITCVTAPFGDNEYYIGSKKISRLEARNIVRKNFSRIHDQSGE